VRAGQVAADGRIFAQPPPRFLVRTRQATREALMPIIADYVVLKDAKFSLGGSGGDFWLDLPFGLPTGAQLNRAVVNFMLDTTSDDEVNFRILINGSEQYTATYKQNVNQSVHEVVGGLQEGTNSLRFELGEGNTTIRFSDVVLWFQRVI
jgi:hypothetical protein